MIDWLFQQFPSYQVMGSKAFKPTLENSQKILNLLDHPEKGMKFIHVAGSNGKGSVCSYLSSILSESGYKVGLFTSPHILKFPERIRVNGECIPMDDVNVFINNIKNASLDFKPSFFEITFGMALDHFKKEECDICIIETGLGGRLDATNVISPLLSVITTISLEHTNMLGETLEEISTEKAGIIKPGANVVLGNVEPSLISIFEQKATECGAELIHADPSDTSFDSYFIADYQKENFKTILTSLDELENLDFNIPQEAIISGIEKVSINSGYKGRLQIANNAPLTIYDVSHNSQGIKATIESINELNKGELHIIYGTSSDKNLKLISENFPSKAHYYFTKFTNPRTAEIEDLKLAFEGINLKSTHYYNTASDALKDAKANCSESDTILVIGSFFLLSDFF